MTHIINSSLKQGKYPNAWKFEHCNPVPKKIELLKSLNDVRKIASTSDYSMIYEKVQLELLMEDISEKVRKRQFGGDIVHLIALILQWLQLNY